MYRSARNSDKTSGRRLSSLSTMQDPSHKDILVSVMGDGLSPTYFCRSGSVRIEIIWPGGSIFSSLCTSALTLSIPSRVTDFYIDMSGLQGHVVLRVQTSVAWKVWTSGMTDTFPFLYPLRCTLNPLYTPLIVSSATSVAFWMADMRSRHSTSGCYKIS